MLAIAKHLGIAVLLFGAATAAQAETKSVEWPALPGQGFISGRSATTQDVDAGRAVFSLEAEGEQVGQPLNITIPQYALHINQDTGEKTPVIVIQAETTGQVSIVGYLSILDGAAGAGLLFEFELLGLNPEQSGY